MSDSKSIEAALAEHAPFIENLARKLVGDRDRAADLVQEAMVAALRSPEAVKSSGGRRWLSVVMRRKSVSQRRRDGLRAASSLAPNPDHEAAIDSPEAIAVRLERQQLLQEALLSLPEPYRSTLVLHFQDGLSAADIARSKGTASSTVRSHVTRGLAQLRERLDKTCPGGRSEWLAALLPLAYPKWSMTLPLSTSVPLVSALAMKKLLVIAFAVVLAAAWFGPLDFLGLQSMGEPAIVTADSADLQEPIDTDTPNGEGKQDHLANAALVQAEDNRSALRLDEETPLESVLSTGIDGPAAEGQGGESLTISGRLALLDGTPIEGEGVYAVREGHKGGAYDLSANTDSDGRFVLKVDDSASYTITNHPSGESFRSSALENVTAPAQNLELRLDALLFRPTLPADLDPQALGTSGGTIAPFGVPMDKAPFKVSTRGAAVLDDGTLGQWVVPTGPGYAAVFGDYAATVPPGSPSGLYEPEIELDSPDLAALEVTLTGASVAAPGRVSVMLRGDGVSRPMINPGSVYLSSERSGRAGAVIPGRYQVEASVFGPPPTAWIIAKVLQPDVELEAGDVAAVEVVLTEGGGLAVRIDDGEGSFEGTFDVEIYKPKEQRWRGYSMYVSNEDGGYTLSSLEPDVLYRSWEVLPEGPVRFRVKGSGFKTVEEELYINKRQLTEWSPFMERLP